MNYAKRIKEYREIVLISQVELANKLGVGVANVLRWKKGDYEPTMENKRKLRELYKEVGIKEDDNE